MIGGLDSIIFFVPIVYLLFYLGAWLYTRKKFP